MPQSEIIRGFLVKCKLMKKIRSSENSGIMVVNYLMLLADLIPKLNNNNKNNPILRHWITAAINKGQWIHLFKSHMKNLKLNLILNGFAVHVLPIWERPFGN